MIIPLNIKSPSKISVDTGLMRDFPNKIILRYKENERFMLIPFELGNKCTQEIFNCVWQKIYYMNLNKP